MTTQSTSVATPTSSAAGSAAVSGQRWWKIDFHTHTPASLDFGRSVAAARNVTAEQWLLACMLSRLDAVAVTDHNGAGWIDQLTAAYKRLEQTPPAEFRPLVVFPGSEITVNLGQNRVHLLAIFDPSTTSSTIHGILGQCGITAKHGDPDSFSERGFSDCVKAIKSAGGVAIAAHLDRKQGILFEQKTLKPELADSLSLLDAGEFRNLAYAMTLTDPQLRAVVESIAPVAGSDAHQVSELGSRSTWVRMGEPSCAALRIALTTKPWAVLNQEKDPNSNPDMWVREVKVERLTHVGNPSALVLSLHGHANAVIGGRGSGKSTIVECLRMAMRREAEVEHLPEIATRFSRFTKQVVRNDSVVSVVYDRKGVQYRIRFQGSGSGPRLERNDGANWVDESQQFDQSRFPISIYSQRQIGALSEFPDNLLVLIDRDPSVDGGGLAARFAEARERYAVTSRSIRDARVKVKDEQALRGAKADLERDLAAYEAGGHGDILKGYQSAIRQRAALEKPPSSVRDIPGQLLAVADELKPTVLSDAGFDVAHFAELKAIHDEADLGVSEVSATLRAQAGRLEEIYRLRAQKISDSTWMKSIVAAEAAYAALVASYADRQQVFDPKVYADWTARLSEVEARLASIASTKESLAALEGDIRSQVVQLASLVAERAAKRSAFVKSVLDGNEHVQVVISPLGQEPASLIESLRDLLAVERFDDTLKTLVEPIIQLHREGGASGDGAKLAAAIDKLKHRLTSWAVESDSTAEDGIDRRFLPALVKKQQQDPGFSARIAAWYPEDGVLVKYGTESGFRRLSDGSLGQKAAAILAFILSYGSDPLVIDQPEEDLDNALITDLIVTGIRLGKMRRQIIVITHNSNIVVNGDVELVHALQMNRGQVSVGSKGALTDSSVRISICTIMEGGKEALRQRFERLIVQHEA